MKNKPIAAQTGARLTCAPDAEDSLLFRSIEEGRFDEKHRAARGILGVGSIGLALGALPKKGAKPRLPLRRASTVPSWNL